MLEQRKFWTGAKIRLWGFEATVLEDFFESDRYRSVDTVAIDYLGNKSWEKIHSDSELNRHTC